MDRQIKMIKQMMYNVNSYRIWVKHIQKLFVLFLHLFS